MGVIHLTGFETGDTAAAKSSAGTFAFVSGYDGGLALQVNPTTTGTGYVGLGTLTTTTGIPAFFPSGFTLQRFYFQPATLPSSLGEQFISCQTTSGGQNWALQITSTGFIQLYNTSNSLIDTSSSALTAGQWYLIEIASDNSGAAGALTLKLNGVQVLSNTCAMGSLPGEMSLGKRTNRNGKTVDFRYDHWIMRDDVYPGDGRIQAVVPIQAGSVNDFTAGTNSSDWQEVDEIPVDTTTYVQSTAAANKNALFKFNTASNYGYGLNNIDGIVVYALGIRENTSGTSACKVQLKSGATTVGNSTALNATTTPANLGYLAALDPNTGSAWTTSAFNALEAGLNLGAANAIAVRLSAVILEVSYKANGAATGGPGTETLSAPAGTSKGGAAISSANSTVTESAPAASAAGSSAATASFVDLTLSPASASAVGGSAASAGFIDITASAASASATGDSAASGLIPDVTLSAPDATADGGSGGPVDGLPFGDLDQLDLSAPDASAAGGAEAVGAIGNTITMSAVTASASGTSGSQTVTGGGYYIPDIEDVAAIAPLAALDLVAPEADARASASVTIAFAPKAGTASAPIAFVRAGASVRAAFAPGRVNSPISAAARGSSSASAPFDPIVDVIDFEAEAVAAAIAAYYLEAA